MTYSTLSRRIGSAGRTAFLALVAGTAAALGCALLLGAGAHRAEAGVNVWTSHRLPGGNVLALAVDPTAPATLYAGTSAGGLYKSTDGGATWTFLDTGLTYAIDRLVIDPTTSGMLYAGTSYGALYRSTDGGDTWSSTGTGLPPPNALVIAPKTPATLYVATSEGVFKTTDGGSTWNAASAGLPGDEINVSALAVDPSAPDTLYAGLRAELGPIGEFFRAIAYDGDAYGGDTSPLLFKSTDGGETWTAASTGLPGGVSLWSGGVRALAVDPITPSTLYVGTIEGVFKSTDGGGTWAPIGLSNVFSLAVDPTQPATLYATTDTGVFRSANGGDTWEAANEGLNAFPDTLAIDPNVPGTLYAGSRDGGLFKSTDRAATWASTGFAYAVGPVGAIAVDSAAPGTLYAGTEWGFFKSIDGGATWGARAIIPPYNYAVVALAVDPAARDTLYAGLIQWAVVKSTDGGATWTVLTHGDIRALAVDPITPRTVYAGEIDGILKSTDAGATWSATRLLNVIALAIDPVAPRTLYVGTAGGEILQSTDAGITWDVLDAGLPNVYVQTLAVDPTAPDTVYAGTGSCGPACGGAYKSTDGGLSWGPAGLEKIAINVLVPDPTTPGTLYAGTSSCTEHACGGGVFKSTDGGETWGAYNAGLADTRVLALVIDPTTPDRLYAGTDDGRVYSIQQADPCVGACPTETPTPTRTPTPTATRAVPSTCAGDCDDSGDVRIDEVVRLVNMALDNRSPSACPHGIPGDAVDIALLIETMNNALDGCPFTVQ